MLYPLKFKPILKQTLWGGSKLAGKGSNPHIRESIGESWEISGVQDNISEVAEGPLAENTLEELIEIYMGDLVGDKVYDKFGVEFPLLIKYIDARDNLSIQVHPDDATAKERHNAYGKTEMWYLLDAEPEAGLIMGFKHDTTQQEYLQGLHNNTLPALLNTEKVEKGDCFSSLPAPCMLSVKAASSPKSNRPPTSPTVFTITIDGIKTEIHGNYIPTWQQTLSTTTGRNNTPSPIISMRTTRKN